MATMDKTVVKEKLEALRSTHTLYQKYSGMWNLCLSAYEGGADFANTDNIFQHARENKEDFNDRAKRLHYLNYCEQLVDFFTNFIFSEPIDRNSGTSEQEFYNKFCSDVDKMGSSVSDYMKRVCEEVQIFGMCYTLVDAPPAPTGVEVVTRQTEQEQGIRPYWVLLRPDEILDWVVDEFDAFLYAKRRQYVNTIGADNAVRVLERFTEFYADRILVTDVDITDDKSPVIITPREYNNALGKVPIYVHRFKRSKRYPFMGNSFLRDFAYNNREIMNLTSLLQEFLYRQCFNLLAKEVESGIPLTSQEEGTFGTSNVLEVPKGAQMPKYISPPADPAKFLQEERQLIKREMYERASQSAMQELFNGEGASGFSQAQSFSKTIPFISSRADNLERDENALMALTFARLGKEWKGRVKYKDRYELTNLTDALTQFLTITRDLGLPSETFDKTQLKRFVREYDGKLPQETLAKIEKEIDAMDYETWKRVQETALVGKPKSEGISPGEQQKPKSTGTMAEVQAEARAQNTSATKKLKNK